MDNSFKTKIKQQNHCKLFRLSCLNKECEQSRNKATFSNCYKISMFIGSLECNFLMNATIFYSTSSPVVQFLCNFIDFSEFNRNESNASRSFKHFQLIIDYATKIFTHNLARQLDLQVHLHICQYLESPCF